MRFEALLIVAAACANGYVSLVVIDDEPPG